MVNKNYLLRKQSKGDKRRIILKISAKGKRAIKLLAPTILQNRKTALGGISLKDLSQLSSTLNKIIDNCKEKTNVEAKIKIKN
jgi:DNA-binding MarR family transcriptional regulator